MSVVAWRESMVARGKMHWMVVATVCVGAFMAALDAGIMNIALPHLERQFHTAMNTIEWVNLSYMLALAALIVPFSRLSDMYGRSRMYILGFSVFVVGSALCGVAPKLWFLIAARVLQASGAAMLQSNSVSLITDVTPAHARGKAIGIQASAQGVGLSLGPAVGGAVLATLGWRWIFYLNVPVGILGTVLGVLLLPPVRKAVKEHFDLLGTLLFAPFLIAFIFVLNEGVHRGMSSPLILVCDAVIVGGFLAFVWAERRAKFPLIDPALIRIPAFSLGNLTVVLSFMTLYAVMFLGPFYLDGVLNMGAFEAGLYMTLVPAGMALCTPVAGTLSDSLGSKLPSVTGLLLMTLGAASLSVAASTHHISWLVMGLFVVGVGMGMFTPPNNSDVMGAAPTDRVGIAGGILNTSRTVGMGLGVSLGAVTYQISVRLMSGIQAPPTAPHNTIGAFQDAFLCVATLAALTTVLVLFTSRSNRRATKVNSSDPALDPMSKQTDQRPS